MGVEIEHKFLVKTAALPKRLPRGEKLEQGYLSIEPAVRVRIITNGRRQSARLTIKGRGLRERAEFEYAIPVSDARGLLLLCGEKTIVKTRRRIGGWELDEFNGRHAGLWIAEYELASAKDKLPTLPAWVGREVTGDRRYTNNNLSLRPWKASRR